MVSQDEAACTWGPAMDGEQAVALGDRLVCAIAPVTGGKTAFLVEKAASLVTCDDGSPQPQVLAVVNTDEQARVFRARLAARGVDPARICVDVAHRVLLGRLADRGQRLRLITRAELNIVIEDLKYEGVAPRDIRLMLQAMRRGLARLVAPGAWGMAEPALEAYQALRRHLDDLGGTLREELPARVTELVSAQDAGEEAGTGLPYDYVLVDDAQNLALGTLRALTGLARQQAVVVGNPLEALPGFDPCFTPDSFVEFASCGATCVSLAPVTPAAPAMSALGEALCEFAHEGTPFGREPVEVDEVAREAVLYVKWREPKDEVEGTCRIVRDLLDADPDLLPGDVCIAVPTRAMAHAFEVELDRRHMPYQTLLEDDPVAGDPRSPQRLGTLGAYALLALAANQDDPCAWRLWLALGRDDLGCGLWHSLRELCRSRELSLGDALNLVAGVGGEEASGSSLALSEDLRAVRTRVLEALDALHHVEGKRGFTLRNHLCRRYPVPQLAHALEFFDGVEEADELFHAFQELSFAPSLADRPSQIRIASYRIASTLSPKHVFLPGLVEGIMPAETPGSADEATRARMRGSQRRLLGCAAATARESLTVSSFQRASVEQAEHEKLPVRRTRRYQGREMAIFLRSAFLEDAGESMPGSVSGEQYFIDERGGKR